METQNIEEVEVNGEMHPIEDTVWSEELGCHLLESEAHEVLNEDEERDWVDQANLDANYTYTEDEEYCHNNIVWCCYVDDCYYYDTGNQAETYCGHTVNDEVASYSDYWQFIDRGQAEGYWLEEDDCAWCEDLDGYCHIDDATWCERNECYYWDEDKASGPQTYGEICDYHESKNNLRTVVDNNSKYFIGFEIEKNYFTWDGNDCCDNGDWVTDELHEFIAGYETDSSCGVEAVTNILPLASPRSRNRKHVFELMDEAEEIISSPYDSRCGGHMTISVRQKAFGYHDGYDVVDKLRQKIALLYALYRHRLRRSYCSSNKPAKKEDNSKYSPVNVKGSRVEFRIPSAIRNVKQLKLRYDLMYKMLYLTYERPTSFEVFLTKVRHIVRKMYNGNDERVEDIYRIARHFRKYLIAEEVANEIETFINDKKEE